MNCMSDYVIYFRFIYHYHPFYSLGLLSNYHHNLSFPSSSCINLIILSLCRTISYFYHSLSTLFMLHQSTSNSIQSISLCLLGSVLIKWDQSSNIDLPHIHRSYSFLMHISLDSKTQSKHRLQCNKDSQMQNSK